MTIEEFSKAVSFGQIKTADIDTAILELKIELSFENGFNCLIEKRGANFNVIFLEPPIDGLEIVRTISQFGYFPKEAIVYTIDEQAKSFLYDYDLLNCFILKNRSNILWFELICDSRYDTVVRTPEKMYLAIQRDRINDRYGILPIGKKNRRERLYLTFELADARVMMDDSKVLVEITMTERNTVYNDPSFKIGAFCYDHFSNKNIRIIE